MLQKQSSILTTNFLFITLLLYSFAFSDELVCDPRDESSLLAFSANLSSPSPLNWSSSTSCCRWEGIDCDTNGRVIGVELYARGLKGEISAAIGNLVSLTRLNLSNNELYGPLDDGILALANLRTLDFSANSISGPIPREIGSLSHLERLHLGENNLSGPIPSSLMKCTNLIEIILSNNHLVGDISELDLSKLLQLQKLDLLNNTFRGPLPTSIYSCKSLVAIRVAANNITDQISPEILELKSLSYLSLTQNSFTNITRTLTILAECNNLTTLFLGTNFYGENLPSDSNFFGSAGFPQLELLSLDGCNLTGSFPEWLSNIKTLKALGLSKNNFTGKIPDSLGALPNLFSLDVNTNNLSGEIPRKLCLLPALMSKQIEPKLNRLNLELPFYSLSHGQFKQYNTFPSSIHLSNNKFNGHIPSEIGNLQGLQRMHFSNNYFSGNIPATVSNMTDLEVLELSKNNLTGEIPPSLANLHFLSHIDISYNDLEGPIPTGGQFDTFKAKDFQGNPRLCGEIIQKSCSPEDKGEPVKSGSHKRRPFLQGLYVGLASGFSGVLVIVASYVWVKTAFLKKGETKSQQVLPTRGGVNTHSE